MMRREKSIKLRPGEQQVVTEMMTHIAAAMTLHAAVHDRAGFLAFAKVALELEATHWGCPNPDEIPHVQVDDAVVTVAADEICTNFRGFAGSLIPPSVRGQDDL